MTCPGLCPIAKETAKAAPTLCTEYGSNGWMDGYTYYWSGHSDGYHAQGVAVAVSNKPTPMIIEVTSVNERLRLRIRHSLGVISMVSV